jgi:DNA helicase-2/ATP-dependent DNA helicase PcrA
VFAVGDDDQSIYAFRGARVGNMADFLREYGVAAPIKLEENYRSHSHILDAANELIGHNEQRLGKNLRTAQPPGEPVRAYEAASDFAEAQWVLDEIRQLALGDGLARAQIAILYRSNAQSRVVETALFNAGIPYRVYGGLRFFERAEIKHALAYLRLLDNPRDDTSFLRVVNFPPRGIGARTVEQLQDAARAQGSALADAAALLPGAARGKVESFIALLTVLRERTAGKTLREIVERVLDDSGLLEHYRAERDGADRLENLEELASAAEAFVTQEGFGRDSVALPLDETGAALTQSPVSQGLDPDAPLLDEEPTGETLSPLAAFLTHAALEAGDNQAQAGQDAVQLMTVHAAKGLEFDAVFITGLEEGLFPHENAQSDRASLEEERRLMYVAITRARQRLYLTHAQTRLLHGQTRYSVPSRFFDELPAPSLKWVSPRHARGAHMPAAHGQGQTWFDRYTLPKPAWGVSARAGSAPEPASASTAGAGATALRPGQKVFHNKFGEGTVRAVEGSGDDARAQVDFPRHGVKWLALAVAKLTVI